MILIIILANVKIVPQATAQVIERLGGYVSTTDQLTDKVSTLKDSMEGAATALNTVVNNIAILVENLETYAQNYSTYLSNEIETGEGDDNVDTGSQAVKDNTSAVTANSESIDGLSGNVASLSNNIAALMTHSYMQHSYVPIVDNSDQLANNTMNNYRPSPHIVMTNR